MQQRLDFRIDEAVGNYFLVAFVIQHGFYTFQRQIRFTMRTHDKTRLNRRVRDIVITVYTGDFFDQVFFNFHIETPARRDRFPLILPFRHVTTQTTQNVAHLLIRNMVSDQTIQFATTKRNGCAFWQRVFVRHVNDWTRFAAADIDQQARCTFHGLMLQSRINTTLIAVRSIGVQTVTTCATCNRQRAEECTFQQDVLRFIIHAGMFATKDAAHRQRFVMVRNHQRIRIQLRFAAIQQYQGLTLFCHTDNNSAFNAVFVECVHRLAQFEQHIVSHVNHGID